MGYTILGIPIDGNWVDIGSCVTGAIFVVYRWLLKPHEGPRKLLSKHSCLDFANGASLFPLLIMVFSVASTTLLNGLLTSSKLTLTTAGLFAIIAILEDAQPQEKRMFH